MKFLIRRASLGEHECPHNKAIKIALHHKTIPEKIQELYLWTIEINSLDELLKFIQELSDDPNRPDHAWSEPQIILRPSFKWNILKKIWNIVDEDKNKYPKWEIKIYDYWVE